MSDTSQSNSSAGAAADPTDTIAAFWTQWLEQSSRGTQALLEAMEVASDPQKAQQRWLEAVGRSLDSFMRSPAFLETMNQNLQAITALKGAQDQVVQGAVRQLGIPLAGDIAGLFERLNSTEQTILKRLRAIEEQLKALEPKH
jgi:hypothetical protein